VSRSTAAIGPDAAGLLRGLGASVLRQRDDVGGAASPAAAALLPAEPGHAEGPVAVAGLLAVGEVTLHNRAELVLRLAAGPDPAPADCGDLELLVRCYRRQGLVGVAAAEGMFAVALVDGDDLVLLRDHVGARTLFHARVRGGWVAATSLRALRRCPGVDTGLDLAAVRSFLTFAYLPGEETLLRGVREALPGRATRLGPDGRVTTESFWEPVGRAGRETGDLAAEAAGLRTLLAEATGCRLPAGEPVAVLLSGGIDSSLVTALAARLHDREVRTYSVAFGRGLPDELAYSGLVALHCGTRHRVLTVPGRRLAARLPAVAGLLDCPVGDPLTVPNLLLAEAVAADGHRVVLNGEGGDPVFGGPKNLPSLVAELHREDPGERARASAYLRTYRKCGADLPYLLTAEALRELASAPSPERHVQPYLRTGAMPTLLDQLLYCNLRTKGAHHILPKVERITASQGLQGRSPLFDRRVVDRAFAIPPRLKLAGAREKLVLKEAVRDLLPPTIVDRPKSGMQVPVQLWLRGPLRDLTRDALLGRAARTRGIVRGDTVESWLQGRGSLLPRQGGKVWLVLTLELWLASYDVG
jgi:asparagine synthase (glutamine-hydrolysing)